MLLRLIVRDFVIVDRIELEFGGGFGALTGETGAGKSILVDALSLALGERADATVVRSGAERAEISAEFDVAPGSALDYPLAAGRLGYVQVISGRLAVNGVELSAGDGAKIAEESALHFAATDEAEILLFDLPPHQ